MDTRPLYETDPHAQKVISALRQWVNIINAMTPEEREQMRQKAGEAQRQAQGRDWKPLS